MPPFRRGKVVKLDPKSGVAHVDLLKQETETLCQTMGDASIDIMSDDGEDRVFFLLKVNIDSLNCEFL